MKNCYAIIILLLFTLFTPLVNAQPLSTIEWQKTIGGSIDENGLSIQQTPDGGYILVGTSKSDSSGDKTQNSRGAYDYWVIKLDAQRNISWQRTIGTTYFENANMVIRVAKDGGYLLAGSAYPGEMSGDKTVVTIGAWDCWLIKLDDTGRIQWQKGIFSWNTDIVYSMEPTADSGYILGISSDWQFEMVVSDKTDSSYGLQDYWLVKIDKMGAIQWNKSIGGASNDILIKTHQTRDGGYILGGNSSSNISGEKTEPSTVEDLWIIKLDAAGNIVWQKTIKGNAWEQVADLQQTKDGGYLVSASSNSGVFGDKTEPSQDNSNTEDGTTP